MSDFLFCFSPRICFLKSSSGRSILMSSLSGCVRLGCRNAKNSLLSFSLRSTLGSAVMPYFCFMSSYSACMSDSILFDFYFVF